MQAIYMKHGCRLFFLEFAPNALNDFTALLNNQIKDTQDKTDFLFLDGADKNTIFKALHDSSAVLYSFLQTEDPSFSIPTNEQNNAWNYMLKESDINDFRFQNEYNDYINQIINDKLKPQEKILTKDGLF